ncbi:hypothetical protein [Taibaiella koreensis]|uniref:hypothetical protein n=1 Tax=Taibaiella koreensis TaxID=1268548 RepID=UPI0019698759|nr:hypothetical protein [Taibaiella koreensis]
MRAIVTLLLGSLPQLAGAQKAMPAQVSVSVVKATDDDNLILYRQDRPLKSGDFKGRSDKASPGVGTTYSGILMTIEGNEERGVMKVAVTLTIYFDKSRSWMKKEGRNATVLAHEQLHFDLTTIKACDLVRAIAAEHYDIDNVKPRLRALQQQYTQALGELQQAYDRETRHGTLPEEQEQWAQRVARDLAADSCW